MKYNTISYERSRKKYDDIQTARVELTVEAGDEPHGVMELASAFVDTQLGLKADALERFVDELDRKKNKLENAISNLERQLTQAQERWDKAATFLIKHGLSIEDEAPF